MMVTPSPHHQQQQQQQQQQVRVAGEGKTMTTVSGSNNNENEDRATAATAQVSFSNDTNDSENSSSQVTNSSSSWRASQRASLRRLEATQKLNLILPQQQPQQVQPQNVNTQTGANYLLTTHQYHQQHQQNSNKLTNCLSTPVIITSDGHHLGHHHHLYLSPTASQHHHQHQQQQLATYNSQQQQQLCPTSNAAAAAAAAAAANQQLLIDSLAHQLNQQNGEVSLFTGLPSCTPASADRLAASAINPFFWNATSESAGQSQQQGCNSRGADEQMHQQQNQWVSEQMNQQQQQGKMHAAQNASNIAQHSHTQKLNIAASALSPIILSPLFLGLSPEQESWLRYGYMSPQQHPLANRTYTDYNQQQQHNNNSNQHQLNFSMQQAQQVQQQHNQAAKDLTQTAAANQRQQQHQARTSTTTTGHLNHSYNTQQLGASLGKSGAYFHQQQQQQPQLEQNQFHTVSISDSHQRQHHLPPQISPAPATGAQQQRFAQHASPMNEARTTPVEISNNNQGNSATPAGHTTMNDGYQQQQQQRRTSVLTENSIVNGDEQMPTTATTELNSRPISRGFNVSHPLVVLQADNCSERGRNSVGSHLLSAQGPPSSARASPAGNLPSRQSNSSRHSSTTSSSSSASATNSTLSSRTTSRLSSYDVSPAISDMELSNAAASLDRRQLARTDSPSCSDEDGPEPKPRRPETAATSHNPVNGQQATSSPVVIKSSSNGTSVKQANRKKSRLPSAPEPAAIVNGTDEMPVKKKSRGGRKKKQVTHEELMARKNRSKERNRVAARRCRQKRKQFLDELRDRIDQLNASNVRLQRENLMLRNELSSLKQTHEVCQDENSFQQAQPQQQQQQPV